MLGKTSANAPSTNDSRTVQITHPTHPLRGQSFKVVPLFGGKSDPTQILIALPNGEQRLIPSAWTDVEPPSLYPPSLCFLLEQLTALRQRLDALLAQARGSAILKATQIDPNEAGGSHANLKFDSVGSAQPRAACSDYCHSSADAPASVEPDNGGRA